MRYRFPAYMKERETKLLVLGLVLLVFCLSSLRLLLHRNNSSAEYWWVWAGISLNDVPADKPVFLYQGRFDGVGTAARFQSRGLYPYPIRRKHIALVFRLHDMAPLAVVLPVIKDRIDRWKYHHVTITEVQLDFDAPTERLNDYASYLKRLRRHLPAGVRLSVTGLGTWLFSPKPEAFKQLSGSVDNIVFQLYLGRRSIRHIAWYVDRLKRFPYPFSIGLLPSMAGMKEKITAGLGSKFRGIFYFYQRGK